MPRAQRFRNEKGLLKGVDLRRESHTVRPVFLFAARRRATRPAIPAPNSIAIGGAGTSVPPVEPPTPLDDEELEEVTPSEEDEVLITKPDEPPDDELDDDELNDDEPELVTAPLDVLTLPDDVDTPPVDVLIPPVEVVDPPVDELVELPAPVLLLLLLMTILMPPLLVDVPGSPLLVTGGGLGGGAGNPLLVEACEELPLLVVELIA